jgi:hypothetical protein
MSHLRRVGMIAIASRSTYYAVYFETAEYSAALDSQRHLSVQAVLSANVGEQS